MGFRQLLGQGLATLGQSVGAREYGLSELITGSSQPTVPFQGSVLTGNAFNRNLSQAQSPAPQSPSSNTGQVLGLGTEGPSVYTDNTSSGGLSSLTGNTYNAPTQPTNVFNDAGDAAQAQSSAELSALNTQYDRLRSEAESQLPYLQGERDRSLSSLANELTGLKNTVTGQKDDTQRNTDRQVADAGQVARDTQRSNRNTLRALGILNSTAAGELLSKPLQQFDKVRAGIVQEGTRRLQELDNFLNEKTSEHAGLIAQIEDRYAQLIGSVQNDLRFNERERADAIQAANSALQQRLSEIQQAQFNWKTQIDTMKMQLAGELNSIQQYAQPTADLGAIQSSTPEIQQTQTPTQVGLAGDEEKKRLSALLG